MLTEILFKSFKRVNESLHRVADYNSTIIDAIEKQTPRKPYIIRYRHVEHDKSSNTVSTYGVFMCPTCWDNRKSGSRIYEDGCRIPRNIRYCPNCGQALDWNR